MAFQPEFSSTATYANRYDLDQISVFLEGDSTNPMFFNISGLPQNLAFGKHYFYLSTINPTFPNNKYELRQGSKILFEFKSINNVVLRSNIISIDQGNGVATGYVEVLQDPLRTYKEIEDGRGTLTIVGSLEDKENTVNSIPEKFKGAMNYRCIFPIEIRKNIINADSPLIIQTEHKQTTIRGQFSFSKATISSKKYTKKGNTYDSAGNPNNYRGEEGGGSSGL